MQILFREIFVSIKECKRDMEQEELFESEISLRTNENFKMCYKLVTGKEFISNDDFSNDKIELLLNLFESFKTSKPLKFKKLNINDNTRLFIEKLLETDDDEFIEILLNDFSKEMNTKMREKDNYVILIRNSDALILAHSKMGEQSINTNFDVFERLLDKDNVMRIVFFEKEDGIIKVRHYEKNKSKFFIEWLGLPQENLFYSFGGENKFYSEIQGFPIVLEISDEDIDSIKHNDYIDIDDGKIKFKNGIESLPINHIMRQRMKYVDYNHFKRDFISRKYDLLYYKKEYIKLNESLDPSLSKIYDCETEVKGGKFYLEKINQNMIMLFCNKLIDLDENFLNKIISLFLNDEPSKITHVGDEFSENPLEIGNIKIYNKFKLTFTKNLVDYLNEEQLSDTFKKDFIYAIFCCLKFENPKMDIISFIDKFLSKFIAESKFVSDNLRLINDILIEHSFKFEKTGVLKKLDSQNTNVVESVRINSGTIEKYDVFISYSSKDKKYVSQLYEKLKEKGLNIWCDNRLRIGDNVRKNINEGLNNCEYGIVVLSQNYIVSFWPNKEYDSLYPLMENGKLIPINHGLNKEELDKFDKSLHNIIYRKTDEYSVEEIVDEICQKIKCDN